MRTGEAVDRGDGYPVRYGVGLGTYALLAAAVVMWTVAAAGEGAHADRSGHPMTGVGEG